MATSAEPKLAPKMAKPIANSTAEVNHSAALSTSMPTTARTGGANHFTVPNRLTSHAEQRMPLIEPMDKSK